MLRLVEVVVIIVVIPLAQVHAKTLVLVIASIHVGVFARIIVKKACITKRFGYE